MVSRSGTPDPEAIDAIGSLAREKTIAGRGFPTACTAPVLPGHKAPISDGRYFGGVGSLRVATAVAAREEREP